MIRLSGGVRSSLIIGAQGIRARKLRTLLSMVSLFLGVLAVVVVQTGSETAKRALLSNLELTVGRDGTRVLSVPPGEQALSLVVDATRGRDDAVAAFSVRAVIGEPNVTPVNEGGAPLQYARPPLSGAGRLPGAGPPGAIAGSGGPVGPGGPPFGPGGPAARVYCDPRGFCYAVPIEGDPTRQPPGEAIELTLTALTGDVRQFKPLRLHSGQWLDFGGAPSMAPRLVLNLEAAKGFNRYLVPAEMRIDGAIANPTPQIVGVVDDGQQSLNAYVVADELLNWLPLTGPGVAPGRAPSAEVLMAPGADAVAQTLRTRLGAVAGIPADQLQIQVINSREDISTELALVRWIFLGMAGLVLLIGVAGILNVGLATVGERVEEFALRRAVGTPRSLLAAIVLAETMITGLLTAGAAIGAGVVGVELLGGFVGDQEHLLRDLQFPWQAGVAGVIAGLVAGVLGGLIPAVRAARIPIATVMRA
jgi:putative ABC transport system permease protein